MAVLHLSVTLDCVDLERVGEFWSATLGFDDVEIDGDYMLIRGNAAISGVRGLTLQRVSETKSTKNRMHLDLVTADVGLEVTRLVKLGARVLVEADASDPYETVVMGDPEGHEFCVIKAQS